MAQNEEAREFEGLFSESSEKYMIIYCKYIYGQRLNVSPTRHFNTILL